jgi:hypothetical protein
MLRLEGLKGRAPVVLLATISLYVVRLSPQTNDIRVSKNAGGGSPVGFPVRSNISKRYFISASLKS